MPWTLARGRDAMFTGMASPEFTGISDLADN